MKNKIITLIVLTFLFCKVSFAENFGETNISLKTKLPDNFSLKIYYVPLYVWTNIPYTKEDLKQKYYYMIHVDSYNMRKDPNLKKILEKKLKLNHTRDKFIRPAGFHLYAELIDEKTGLVFLNFMLSFDSKIMSVNDVIVNEELEFIQFVKYYIPNSVSDELDDYIKRVYNK